jgi:CxxC motif-containing protein (DUF1111 family)
MASLWLLALLACSHNDLPLPQSNPVSETSPVGLAPSLRAPAVKVSTRHLLAQPDSLMPILAQLDFAVGRSFFRNPWVQAPATTSARDGLGPLYNANSCASCHVASGRGLAAVDGQPLRHQVVHLSVPIGAGSNTAGFVPEPRYGRQLQSQSMPALPPEGQALISYREVPRRLAGGETVMLRQPIVRVAQLAYGDMVAGVNTSVRSAPVLTGLGLLEAVPETQLLAWADPDDADGDGISGHANRVWDISRQQQVMGRFGWKAEQPSVLQQSAAAFHADMGISSSFFTGQNCTTTQVRCQHAVHGGEPEITDKLLAHVALYVANLAVPMPLESLRDGIARDEVVRGKALFEQAGCQSCHRAALTTGSSPFPWLSQRHIFPYTDLLLHDMGAELADNRAVFAAGGREWRTAPLWGIGLAKKVAPQIAFLHDGRARTLLEAILWHGGEAQQSRAKVEQMTVNERRDLVGFLESL